MLRVVSDRHLLLGREQVASAGNGADRRIVYVSVRRTLPLPCFPAVFVAKTLPLPRVSTAFVAKPLLSLAVLFRLTRRTATARGG